MYMLYLETILSSKEAKGFWIQVNATSVLLLALFPLYQFIVLLFLLLKLSLLLQVLPILLLVFYLPLCILHIIFSSYLEVLF